MNPKDKFIEKVCAKCTEICPKNRTNIHECATFMIWNHMINVYNPIEHFMECKK